MSKLHLHLILSISGFVLFNLAANTGFSRQSTDSRSNVEIDRLMALSSASIGDGQLADVVMDLKKAVQIAEIKSPWRLYDLYHQLTKILPDFDPQSMIVTTDRMAAIAEKQYGSSDYRTIYSHTLQDVNAADYSDDKARALKNIPARLIMLQHLAQRPQDIAETATLGADFASTLIFVAQDQQADKVFDASLALMNSKPALANLDAARFYILAANLMHYRKEFTQAIDFNRRATALLETLSGPYASDLAMSLAGTGTALIVVGKASEAEPLFVQALAIAYHGKHPVHKNVLKVLDAFGKFYYETGKPELAEALFKRAVSVCDAVPDTWGDTENILGHLSALYLDTGKLDLARDVNKREIELATRQPRSPYIVRAYLRAARIELQAGNLAAADAAGQKASQFTLMFLPKGDQGNAFPLAVLARIATKKGDVAAAAKYWSQTLPYIAKLGFPNRDHETAVIHASFANIQASLSPNWTRAREAGDSLTGRITDAALSRSNTIQFNGYEQNLYNELLDVAWVASK